MLSTSNWLLITSFFSLWQMPVSHRASSSSISPEGQRDSCTKITSSIGDLHTFRCKQQERTGQVFILEWSHCQKQLRSHVQQTNATNVTWHYLNSTPWGSCSLRSAYARLSLPCCGNKNNCLLGFHSPQRGSVCNHVMNISTLKLAPLPSQFIISRRAAKGRGHVQRDLFDLLQWLLVVLHLSVSLGDHEGAYFPRDCIMSVQLFMRACLYLIC